MSGSEQVRIADADRERGLGELKGHFLDGRLTTEEFGDRVAAVYAAGTRGELARPFADLPPLERRWNLPHLHRPHRQPTILATLAALGVPVWVFSSANEGGEYWPFFPLAAYGLLVAAQRGARKTRSAYSAFQVARRWPKPDAAPRGAHLVGSGLPGLRPIVATSSPSWQRCDKPQRVAKALARSMPISPPS